MIDLRTKQRTGVKEMKKRIILALILIVFLLCSCGKSSTSSLSMDKKSSSMDYSAASGSEDKAYGFSPHRIIDEFYSSDESAHYIIDADLENYETTLPTAIVTPHTLTEEDARRIAFSFFDPYSDFAEYDVNRPAASNEIEKDLTRWTEYLDEEKLNSLYSDPALVAYTKSVISRFIENYTALLPNAPSTSEKVKCSWTFSPDEKYQFEGSPGKMGESGLYSIRTETEWNGIPYTLYFFTRDKDDYRINNVSIFISENKSPNGIDKRIMIYDLCSGPKPTEKQIDAARTKAQTLLSAMALGDWKADYCEAAVLEGYGSEAYTINIKAVPVFSEIAAARHQQLTNLKSSKDSALNYYYTDAEFVFSPNGELIDFTLFSPVDLIEVSNENGTILSIDVLLEEAEKYFIQFDSSKYSDLIVSSEVSAPLRLEAMIENIQTGLSRSFVPDTPDKYYYVPSITFTGNYSIINTQTNETVFLSDSISQEPFCFLTLNAIDGSIINTRNP